MAEHHILGKLGEKLAVDFLLKKGYDILEQNYRYQKAEIDIIAQHGQTLVVIEVKTRSTPDFGDPQDFVKPKKIQLLVKGINNYIIENDLDVEVRFDIIGIIGINYFDTADLYQFGENEIMLGKAIKDFRKDIIIGTKVGNQWNADKTDWIWNPTKAYILKSVDESLKRLQTDYIDLYQLHGGTIEDPMDDTIEAFEILQKQGKIRYYGVSSIRPNVIKAYIKKSNITSVMMQYSLFDRRPEESCLELLETKRIGVLARGVLAKGLLAGKPSKSYLVHSKSQVDNIIQSIHTTMRNQIPLSQTAIDFVLANEAVTSAVIGMRNQEHLQGCCVSEKTSELLEQLRDLRSIAKPHQYTAHL